MKVAIIGANGKIGRLLAGRLQADERFEPVALIRNPGQAAWFEERGIPVQQIDLEGEFASGLAGQDAVVFTAGSGGHTGKDKTLLVDLWGAVRVIQHCQQQGPRRFIMVSALNASNPDAIESPIKPYLAAKWAADYVLRNSGLDHTILAPGSLTGEAATGAIQAAEHLPARQGQIPREDVALAIRHCLLAPDTIGKTYEMLTGETPIAEALS